MKGDLLQNLETAIPRLKDCLFHASLGDFWNRVEWGKMPPPPHCFSQNKHKIKPRSFFVVTMDYVDESDVKGFNYEADTGDVLERKCISQ